MIVTKHAVKAIKKRLGIPKRAIDKRVERAIESGLRHRDLTGRLRKYVDYLYLSHSSANGIILHKSFVFIANAGVLITMYPIPTYLKKLEDAHYVKRSVPK